MYHAVVLDISLCEGSLGLGNLALGQHLRQHQEGLGPWCWLCLWWCSKPMKNSAPVTRMGQCLLNTPPKTNINIDIPKMMVWKKVDSAFFDMAFFGYLCEISGWLRDECFFFQTPQHIRPPSPSYRTLNATLKSFEVWTNS